MKLRFLNSTLAGLALLGACFTANAVIISGEMYTDDGKLVALQGLEWLSLEHTAGLSRADVEDGFTDNYGTSWAAGEWTYADRAQTETLLNSLWGGVYDGWSNDNYDGASWFINNFGGLEGDTWTNNVRSDGKLNNAVWTNYDRSFFIFGNDTECFASFGNTCEGEIASADSTTSISLRGFNINTFMTDNARANEGVGLFTEDAGVNMNLDTYNDSIPTGYINPMLGSLLVRRVEVPEPSTLAVLALGMIGLASRRFKKQP